MTKPDTVLTLEDIDQIRQSLAGTNYDLFGFAEAVAQFTRAKLAQQNAAEVAEPAENETMMHRLMKKEGAAWMPASEWVVGEPDPSWVELVRSNPEAWRIRKPLDGKEVSDAFRKSFASVQVDKAKPVAWRCSSPPCKCSEQNYRQCAFANYTHPPTDTALLEAAEKLSGLRSFLAGWKLSEGCIRNDMGPTVERWIQGIDAAIKAHKGES